MYRITKNEKIEGSEILLHITIEEKTVEEKRSEALKHLNEHANLPGFRKGHIPESIMVKNFGEATILEEATEIALKDLYPKILEEAKIDPLTYPQITITKIAKGQDVEVEIKIPIMPEIIIGDYKSIAKEENSKKEKIDVDTKEVEEVIEEIKKQKKREEEIDDEFAKTLGDFTGVSDLKEKIKTNILHEKEHKAKQKKRLGILGAIHKETKIDIPNVLIESELERMINEFKYELEGIGSNLDSYLKEINKTIDDIKTDWREKADERVANEFIIREIAKEEKIKPDEEKLNEEVKHLKEHHPDTEESRIRSFIEELMIKESVFKFLEEQK